MSTTIEGGPVVRSALARCIGCTVEEFTDRHWGRAPLLTRGEELGQDFSDLFSSAAVDELVAQRGLRTPFARMAKEGVVLPASRFTASGGLGAEVGDQLSSEQVAAELVAGATLVLQGLHRTWQPLAAFTRALAADLGHPCQVNAYVTPPSSRGFDPHYDVHDVFVLQIQGEKRWTIHEPVYPDPLRSQPWSQRSAQVAARAQQPPVIEATFRSGDALYLPRGWIHSATALGGTSIHLTIGVPAYNRHDIVTQALALAMRSPGADDAPELRRSLPVGAGRGEGAGLDADIRQTLEVLIDRLRQLGGRPELSDLIATELAGRFAADTRPEPVRPLATLDALSHLSDQTVVAVRAGLVARVEQDGDRVAAVAGDKRLTMPSEARAALEVLLRGDPVPVAPLPGLDDESARVVVRRLLREGVLVVRS